ncbi:hypothetical protein ICN19_08330 [Polynucleobacter sp. AP-Capit-er-40B-B4]|uniref:hypothetical protein n=1 Tax=Polynucleobacter sp. AP-Capit-er-40B-B4 TaxID=2576927 RepID=UPI001C0A955B|nr:hypothetical protein [Polynucleobacter sp. AP-Capit-er-40B-B4]MBU3582022.1 hypothetical protein [Polynucleobacter sp. AP-Capit-er-40B-B4]
MPRDVPYFPCYAENILAKREYKLMSLMERGLWISILLECWPNDSVPADPEDLAKCLGFNPQEIKAIPKDRYMKFFTEEFNEISSPELDAQKKGYAEKRRLQSEGGKEGARRKKRKQEDLNMQGQPLGQPEGSSIQVNSSQISSSQLQPCSDNPGDQRTRDNKEFDAVAKAYRAASKG